jgi:hypothetical protein
LAARRRARAADCIVARFFWDLPPQRQQQAAARGFDLTRRREILSNPHN